MKDQQLHIKRLPGVGLANFKSPVAAKFFQIGCLGFLGSLGFVPGWERLLGFSGLFGFIGVASFLEAIHRIRESRR